MLAKVGKALLKIAEAIAAAAVMLLTVWLALTALLWALHQTVTHWRTILTVVGLLVWLAQVELDVAGCHRSSEDGPAHARIQHTDDHFEYLRA